MASTDFLFVFALTLTLFGVVRNVLRKKPGRSGSTLFFVGASLAVLAKGLIGLVLPVLVVGRAAASRRFSAWRGNGVSRVFLVVPGAPERSVLKSLLSERVHFLGQYGSRRLYSNRGD